MRIISNFKDYYDGLQDFDSFTWNRQKREILETEKEFKDVYTRLDLRSWTQERKVGDETLIKIPIILGYCGEYYKYYINCLMIPFYEEFINPTKQSGFYLSEVTELEQKAKWYSKVTFYHLDISFLKGLDLFHRYKSPVFLIHSIFKNNTPYKEKNFQVVVNPSFKNYGLHKLRPIEQTYQDLETYITGVLTSNEIYPEPEDKYRMGGRFDKYSFRRLPERPI